MSSPFEIGFLLLISLLYFFTTVAFCFWIIYLKRGFLSKLRLYIWAKKYDRESISDLETEIVKQALLFLLNIVEWVEVTFSCAAHVAITIQDSNICELKGNTTAVKELICFGTKGHLNSLNSQTFVNLVIFQYNAFFVSLILTAFLCSYLSTKYAGKQFVQTTNIPISIMVAVLMVIFVHISNLFCSLTLFIRCAHSMAEVVLLILTYKHFRSLNKVLTWKINDFQLSQSDQRLVTKYRRMNRRFAMFFLNNWIGCILYVIGQILGNILLVTEVVLNKIHFPNHEHYLCNIKQSLIPKSVLIPLNMLYITVCVLGLFIGALPYVLGAYGTLFYSVWARIKGKQRYTTHYSSHLNTAFVSHYSFQS